MESSASKQKQKKQEKKKIRSFPKNWTIFEQVLFSGKYSLIYKNSFCSSPSTPSIPSSNFGVNEKKSHDVTFQMKPLWKYSHIEIIVFQHFTGCNHVSKLVSPKGQFTGLLLLTLDRNIVLYENDKFTKTGSQLPIDPDPRASLITLQRS